MKKITPNYKLENKGHYSPGIISNGNLYISGQLSIDPDTRKVAEGDISVHANMALSNLERVLEEANLTKENVVLCRVYLTDISHWDEFNIIYSSFFGNHKPARAVVPVSELHYGCLVEIEAIAEIN